MENYLVNLKLFSQIMNILVFPYKLRVLACLILIGTAMNAIILILQFWNGKVLPGTIKNRWLLQFIYRITALKTRSMLGESGAGRALSH